MAMIRLVTIAMILALVGCGDAADGGADNNANSGTTEECEGEHLKLNYRECEGDEAWEAKMLEAEAEHDRRNSEHVDPADDDYVLGCPGDPAPDTVAHHCNYDSVGDSDRCTWRLTTYKGGDDAMPMPYCSCLDEVVESDEAHCD